MTTITKYYRKILTQFLDSLAKFSEEYFQKIGEVYSKSKQITYEAKEAKLKMKQNFQALLSMNDRKFMEHVSDCWMRIGDKLILDFLRNFDIFFFGVLLISCLENC